MKISLALSALLLPFGAYACGGHGEELREWTQEEIDDLERKWGTDVGGFLFFPDELNGFYDRFYKIKQGF